MRPRRQGGDWIDPRQTKVPFDRYTAQWLGSKANVRPQTRLNVEGRVKKHLVPHFGSRPIGSIQPVHVRAFIAQLSGLGLAPSTVKAIYLTLGQVLRTAEIDGLIRRSPCIGIELPVEAEHREMRFLSEAQVATHAFA